MSKMTQHLFKQSSKLLIMVIGPGGVQSGL